MQILDHYSLDGQYFDVHLVNPLKVLVLKHFKVKLQISNLTIQGMQCKNNSYITMFYIIGRIVVYVTDCTFTDNYFVGNIFYFKSSNVAIQFTSSKFINNAISFQLISIRITNVINNSTVHIMSCLFQNNANSEAIIAAANNLQTIISNSTFHDNVNASILDVNCDYTLTARSLILQNVEFTNNNIRIAHTNMILVSNTKVLLIDIVTFSKNTVTSSIFQLMEDSLIVFKEGRTEFSKNIARNVIDFPISLYNQVAFLSGNSMLVFNKNYVCAIFSISKVPFPLCIFQYYSKFQSENQNFEQQNYSIIFNENHYLKNCYRNIPVMDCHWFADSLFSNMIPINVNKKYVKYVNEFGSYNMLPQTSDQKTLCLCKDSKQPDCTVNELGYLYPGQTFNVYIYDNTDIDDSEVKIIIEYKVDQSYISPCLVDTTDRLKYVDNTCTIVNFTIVFSTDSSCALFLRIASDPIDYVNILYINQLQCPLGFVKMNGKCCCDPHLVQAGVLACNINEQSILRPADSWISATITTNKSTYQVSLHCAYCLPYPSHLNLLSATNSQCQYDRSGTLCGQCQQGLSTIFASLQCEKCSNVHLYLIVPIAIAGLVLIIALFLLNLTVTDGTINAFILYVSISGINGSVLLKSSILLYTLMSLANLDLGIQTCFYNGMNDYAKMWLQLAFPFYLIFIATSLIITSRYSTTIQRLTARRALPVLATLFLLSYTKILHTVSIVLFSYSTITQLPTEQSKIVWSVDANVPLLGVKFIILFTTCLIIFLIQVPFTIILLFSRPLWRFHYINKFKPLLDAYQGPYKDQYYYWNGLHLVVRVAFLGIASVNKNSKALVGITLISFLCAVTGIAHPFRNRFQNYHEIVLLLNLQVLYIFAQQVQLNMTAINSIIGVALAHFTIIVLYHIITYVCGGVIRSKIQQSVNTVMGRIRNRSALQSLELVNVPEDAVNYHDYREPLVAQ